jgi:transcription elongation factor GreA
MTDSGTPTRPTAPAPPAAIELTQEGFNHLQHELSALKTADRPALVRRVRRSTLFADPTAGQSLADAARFDLGVLDDRIAEIEAILRRAQIVEPSPGSQSVELGSQVTVRFEDGTEETLTLVGPHEADVQRGYVSVASPAGRALLGKPPGATVVIDSDGEGLTLTVTKIGRAGAATGAARTGNI